MAESGNTSVELAMTAGLPYSRRFRITNGKSVWPTLDLLEVRSQVRVRKQPTSALVGALTPFLTPSYDGDDIVIDLELTGAQTRTMIKGYYDIVVSDVGATDERALSIASGKVKVGTLVTEAADA